MSKQRDELSVEVIEELKRELIDCERKISMLEGLLVGESGPDGSADPMLGRRGRPNAGMRRFLLEAIEKRPGIGDIEIAKAMANRGFKRTESRSLKSIVHHELRRLAREKRVHESAEGYFTCA